MQIYFRLRNLIKNFVFTRAGWKASPRCGLIISTYKITFHSIVGMNERSLWCKFRNDLLAGLLNTIHLSRYLAPAAESNKLIASPSNNKQTNYVIKYRQSMLRRCRRFIGRCSFCCCWKLSRANCSSVDILIYIEKFIYGGLLTNINTLPQPVPEW